MAFQKRNAEQWAARELARAQEMKAGAESVASMPAEKRANVLRAIILALQGALTALAVNPVRSLGRPDKYGLDLAGNQTVVLNGNTVNMRALQALAVGCADGLDLDALFPCKADKAVDYELFNRAFGELVCREEHGIMAAAYGNAVTLYDGPAWGRRYGKTPRYFGSGSVRAAVTSQAAASGMFAGIIEALVAETPVGEVPLPAKPSLLEQLAEDAK